MKISTLSAWLSGALGSAVAVVLLAGCATLPEEPVKRPLLSLVPDQNSAVLVGASLGGVLNNRILLVSVNGIDVPDPLKTAERPIRIQPGPTQLLVFQKAGGFEAAVRLDFKAEPNTSYIATAAQDTDKPWYAQQIYSAGGDTYFWVEKYSTGERVSERVKVVVTMPRSGPTMPIFIPRRK